MLQNTPVRSTWKGGRNRHSYSSLSYRRNSIKSKRWRSRETWELRNNFFLRIWFICVKLFQSGWIQTWTMAIHIEVSEWSSGPGLHGLKLVCEVKKYPTPTHLTCWLRPSLDSEGTSWIKKHPVTFQTFQRYSYFSCYLMMVPCAVCGATCQLRAGLWLSGSVQGLASCTAWGEELDIPALHLCVCVCMCRKSEGPSKANWQQGWQRWSASKE